MFLTRDAKEGKVTFVIYMQTVSQSALCIELEMNENGVGRLFCNVIPTFPWEKS